MPSEYLVVIAGPTAVGKTKLAVQLAKEFHTVVLSADSRQFFREMSIGTARPGEQEMQGVTHYFTGNLSVSEPYNAGSYEEDANKLLSSLFSKHDVVIMTGGSGLYIDAVCRGFDSLPDSDTEIRVSLRKILQEKGIEELRNMLRQKDPAYFEKVDPDNPRRLMRALEICIITGKPYSSFRNQRKKKNPFTILKIGLNMERKKLYEAINSRADNMMEKGFLSEAKQLYPLRHLNALQTVGYQELFDYLEKKISLDEAISRIKQNTRRFAKRQLTWFRKDNEIRWFSPGQEEIIISYIREEIRKKSPENSGSRDV